MLLFVLRRMMLRVSLILRTQCYVVPSIHRLCRTFGLLAFQALSKSSFVRIVSILEIIATTASASARVRWRVFRSTATICKQTSRDNSSQNQNAHVSISYFPPHTLTVASDSLFDVEDAVPYGTGVVAIRHQRKERVADGHFAIGLFTAKPYGKRDAEMLVQNISLNVR